MRKYLVHVTAIAISASTAIVGLAAPASAARGQAPVLSGVVPVKIEAPAQIPLPGFFGVTGSRIRRPNSIVVKPGNFTGLIPHTAASVYIRYGDIKGEFGIPVPPADGISKVGQGVLTLAGSAVARANRVKGNFIGTDVSGAVQHLLAGDFDGDGRSDLGDIGIAPIPHTRGLLLPAVQKVREAAKRTRIKLETILISSGVPTPPRGATGGIPLNRPVVGAAPDPTPLPGPAVQRAREAASRAAVKLEEVMVSS